MATRAGTARFAQALAHNTRNLYDLSVSPFGIGTYNLDRSGAGSVLNAISQGFNLIDTSVHYTRGGSELAVGDAIRRACETGVARREELVVVTKIGHVAEDELASRRWAGGSADARRQVSTSPVGGHHCIHPDLLAEQVAVSTARLGTPPDVVLLHNPEFFFTERLYQGMRLKDKPEADADFYSRIESAFECLEQLVDHGLIGSHYGVSTNPEGCLWSVSGVPNSFESVSLRRLIGSAHAARGARPAHRFRSLQMPLNLLELGGAMGFVPVNSAGDTRPSALREAQANGISVMVNRPLKAIPPYGHASRHMHLGAADLDDDDLRAAIHRALIEGLRAEGVDLRGATLAELALWLAASTRGVDVALCQARQPRHLAQLAAVSRRPRAEEGTVWRAFDLILDEVDRLRPE